MSTTQDDPSLQPTDAAGFEKQIEALRAKSDHIGLPGITIAMWPPRVCFSDDVSDLHMFNERYIEPDFWRGRCSLVLYFCALVHHFVLAIVVYGLFDDSVEAHLARRNYLAALLPSFIFYAFFLLLLGYFFWLCFIGAISPSTRFNRQAQLLHVPWGDQMLHLRWRDVRPFTEVGQSLNGRFRLKLCFPQPRRTFGNVSKDFIRKRYSEPFDLGGYFASSMVRRFGPIWIASNSSVATWSMASRQFNPMTSCEGSAVFTNRVAFQRAHLTRTGGTCMSVAPLCACSTGVRRDR